MSALPDGLLLHAAIPATDEYLALRQLAGLSPFAAEAADIGLPNSWFAVCVRDGDKLVGMGRVIGDGGLFFQVVDIAVDPALHRQGVGRAIMAALMRRLERDAPPGAFVSLLADGPAHRLYAGFGFVISAPASQGMMRRL